MKNLFEAAANPYRLWTSFGLGCWTFAIEWSEDMESRSGDLRIAEVHESPMIQACRTSWTNHGLGRFGDRPSLFVNAVALLTDP